MSLLRFVDVAQDLEHAGLVWTPEIGDEIFTRNEKGLVSILVDPKGMTPDELRFNFLWLPTVEQMVFQLEGRQAILLHAGLELSQTSLCYKTVIQAHAQQIEVQAESLRLAMGLGLRDLLLTAQPHSVH